jgi:dihydrofolate synthase/folylpolyglutamate synthase
VSVARSLADWLAFQQQLHPQAIALGLERVREVAARVGAGRPAATVITVAGTNGKGSTVAMLDAILRAAGYVVGTYTSPHLLTYNERVRVDGEPVDDVELVRAFERIEAVRGDVPLTFFEYGTLAALLVLAARDVDIAVLEVGLGGRLDAVNLVDPDCAVLTTVDLDHQALLGPDRESIGAEKAGIFRAGVPAVIGEATPPASVLTHARAIGAVPIRAGTDFRLVADVDGRRYVGADGYTLALPALPLPGPSQPNNAATAIAALRALAGRLPVDDAATVAGLAHVRLPARLQQVGAQPELRVDVAHNPQAARELAAWLASAPHKRTVAVFAALADKDIDAIVGAVAAGIASWHLLPITDAGARGLALPALQARVACAAGDASVHAHGDAAVALAAARADAGTEGRVLVFGSFHTAGAVLAA